MLKGLLSGVALGTLTSVGVLSVLSLVAEQPAGNTPPLPPRVEAPMPADAAPMGTVAALPQGGVMTESPTLGQLPGVSAPAIEATSPQVDTQVAPTPETGGQDVALTTPEVVTSAEIETATEEPILPSPQSATPQVPVTETDLTIPAPPADASPDTVVVIDPDPAAAPSDGLTADTPEALTSSVNLAPPKSDDGAPQIAASAPDADSGVVPDAVDPAATDSAPIADTASTAPQVTAEAPENAAATGLVDRGTPAPPQLAGNLGDKAPDGTAPVVDAIPSPDAAPVADAPAAPAAGPAPQVGFGGQVAGPLPAGTASVQVMRPGLAPDESSDTAAAETDLPVVDDPAQGALEQFAASVEVADGAPLMGIVLIDDGSMPGGAAALSAAGVAVTIAIPAGSPDATAVMTAYRLMGIEVAALIDLPQGALASDAAVAAEVARTSVPQAVAILQLGARDREVLGELLAAASVQGQGFIAAKQGLDSVTRAAEAVDVPAAELFHDLDSEGQDAAVVRRFMDQAAFRARQDGSVVLLGRVRPDTISALILWATANRGGQVVQVPVSAVLLAGQE